MKLNYKNTVFIGLAFFVILMLWQVYNTYCPLMLKPLLSHFLNIEDENKVLYLVGIIMAVDNIFALFLLPIFGNLSDKTNNESIIIEELNQRQNDLKEQSKEEK